MHAAYKRVDVPMGTPSYVRRRPAADAPSQLPRRSLVAARGVGHGFVPEARLEIGVCAIAHKPRDVTEYSAWRSNGRQLSWPEVFASLNVNIFCDGAALVAHRRETGIRPKRNISEHARTADRV